MSGQGSVENVIEGNEGRGLLLDFMHMGNGGGWGGEGWILHTSVGTIVGFVDSRSLIGLYSVHI